MNSAPRRSSTLRNISVIALFATAAYFLPNLLNRITDALFFPWVHAQPPLLDHWVGRLTTGNGVRLVVAMTLERDFDGEGKICIRCNQVRGTAGTCDGPGTVRRYRISGSPKDRQGRQLHLGATPVSQPPLDGLALETLSGTWEGGDVLDLEADFLWRRGQSAITSTNDPATQSVPLRMERGRATDLDALCAALR